MSRKIIAVCAVVAALSLLSPRSSAQGQTGTLRGTVADAKGQPLAGAYLYISSTSMLGITNAVVSAKGRFSLSALPPGTYRVIVEMPGFKTLTIEGVELAPGAVATVNAKMEASQVEEEAARQRPGPAIDRVSARSATVLERSLLTRLPLPKDFTAVLGLVPGLVFSNDVPDTRASVAGAPATTNAIYEDGVMVTGPVDQRALGRVNVNLIDQVVVETAGRAAAAGPAQGATIYILHQPGTSAPHGGVSYTNASKRLSQSLWSEQEVAEMPGVSLPAPLREHDLSLTLGAPVLEDMAWLFAGFRYRAQNRRAPFRYWTDPLGGRHFVYNFEDLDMSGLFKLTANVLDKFRGALEFSLSNVRQPAYDAEVDRFHPEEATRRLAGKRDFLGLASLTYVVNENTVADLGLSFMKSKTPLLLNGASVSKPQYYDVITGLRWGSGSLNERESASRMKAGLTLTRYQDRLFGLSHQLVAGGEYESTTSVTSVWKANNLIHNYASGSPYTFGRTISPVSGNDVGWGLIGFWIAPGSEGGLEARRELKRVGAFLQDTVRIGGRLSLSAGLRFDRSDARFPALAKSSSGNSISVTVGNSLIDPVLGYNLYGAFSLGRWEKAIVWNSLSPRAGLSFDLFGTGRTILKGSYARTPEYLGLGYAQDLTQANPRASHNFIWLDEDADGEVTGADLFLLGPYDFRVYRNEFLKQAVDPDLKPPVMEEWTAGVEQEIARGFSLSVRYISRRHTNNIGHVLYDPSTEVRWWRVDDSPEGWWVPFTTVVPGGAGYPDVPVSLFLRSTAAPEFFDRIENVPELKAEYRSLELAFRKRMSRNWQLLGSFVWNRARGTTNVASPWSAGNAPVILTPNTFVNIAATDRLPQDRPFVARLAGTMRLRWDVYVSVLFKAQSGRLWARTVTIIPPADWAAANGAVALPVTVFLESPGARRYDAWKTLDLRLEKEFLKAGRARYSISLDVFNLLGDKYRIPDLNDGGTWAPTGPGTSEGVRVLSAAYGTYQPLWGTRSFRFTLGLKF